VTSFYEKLAPAERRAIKHELSLLRNEKGDISPLRETLEGYYRLRVGVHRIIFRYKEGRIIECLYMNSRPIVYELFESELPRILTEPLTKPD
jgi:mRNA-degrading endonuclease RelE of RelBE toxin-antitoxin system